MRTSAPSISDLIWGFLFIGTGLVFLTPSLGYHISFNIGYLWPWFLIVPGLGMWGTFFSSRPRAGAIGLVIPATILTLLGCFFLFSTATGWQYTGQLAFVFPLIVALAFWAAWLLGTRHIGFLIPAVVLSFASATVCVSINLGRFIVPMLFISIGVLVMFRGQKTKGEEITKATPEAEPILVPSSPEAKPVVTASPASTGPVESGPPKAKRKRRTGHDAEQIEKTT